MNTHRCDRVYSKKQKFVVAKELKKLIRLLLLTEVQKLNDETGT